MRKILVKCKALLFLTIVLAFWAVACLNQSAAKSVQNTSSLKTTPVNAGTPTNQNQWVEIIGQDGDFTAAFPVKPEYIFEDRPKSGHTRNNHIFLAQQNGHTLMVSYMDVILSLGEKYDEVQQRKYREAEIIKTKRKEGWEVLSRTNLAGNGYQHIYFAPPKSRNDLPAYFRAITFVRGSRVYLITYDALTRSELFGPEARRFFKSFKFTSRGRAK